MKKTTSTKNQVMDTLMWSSEYYDERLFQSYWNYCHIYGNYPSKIQQLLANSALNKWFIREYAKAEALFLQIAEVTPPSKVEFLRGQYMALTAEVFSLFPKPIIEKVKINKDFSNSYRDKIVIFSN